MPSICLMSTESSAEPDTDNPERLARAFLRAGWTVTSADHDAIRSSAGRLYLAPAQEPLGDFDLIWLIGLGRRETFLDRMQMLGTLDPARFINSPAALMSLHAKHAISLGELRDLHPETHSSNDPEWLRAMIDQGGNWLLKPTAGSYGRGIHRVSDATPGLDDLLRNMTGVGESRYCILQRHQPELGPGETRVLVANERIIGCYRRVPAADYRANLSAGAAAREHDLTNDERRIVERAAHVLVQRGVRFAAIDVAVPFLVEYNLANPGGLETLEQLTGRDPTPDVVAALADLA